jgi:predicted TIM-barrel fold metal-dependent hydrolase
MNSGVGREAANLEDIRIVDCDSHWTEPADLWVSRAPRVWKDRVPVQRTVDGVTRWYLGDQVFASIGGNTIGLDAQKVLGVSTVQPFEAVHASAWSVPERLNLLDAMGIYAQVLYPNGIGFSSNHIFAIEDDAQRTAVLQTYNDFLIDIQSESGGRLFPQGVLPIWDMDLTIQEMKRLLDRGMTGFTISDKPELLGLAELPDPYFQPMWDLFQESGAVTNFHIGSGRRREEIQRTKDRIQGIHDGRQGPAVPALVADPGWSSLPPQRYMVAHASQIYMSNVRIIVNLCVGNLFDRFPKLKIVSAESGIGWVPFILEALEYQYDEMLSRPEERQYAQRRPREYFRDHIYVMFWFEEVNAKMIEDVGVRNVLLETDVPHPTCLYPNPREHFTRILADLGQETQRRIMQENAAELYGILIPA